MLAIGSPARIAKELKPEQIAAKRRSTQGYVDCRHRPPIDAGRATAARSVSVRARDDVYGPTGRALAGPASARQLRCKQSRSRAERTGRLGSITVQHLTSSLYRMLYPHTRVRAVLHA